MMTEDVRTIRLLFAGGSGVQRGITAMITLRDSSFSVTARSSLRVGDR
jgi:hypothetical protein